MKSQHSEVKGGKCKKCNENYSIKISAEVKVFKRFTLTILKTILRTYNVDVSKSILTKEYRKGTYNFSAFKSVNVYGYRTLATFKHPQ